MSGKVRQKEKSKQEFLHMFESFYIHHQDRKLIIMSKHQSNFEDYIKLSRALVSNQQSPWRNAMS